MQVYKEFEAVPDLSMSQAADSRLSSGPSSSHDSSTVSLPKLQTRDSILHPLALITSLEEAEPTVEQILDNLSHVDRSLVRPPSSVIGTEFKIRNLTWLVSASVIWPASPR